MSITAFFLLLLSWPHLAAVSAHPPPRPFARRASNRSVPSQGFYNPRDNGGSWLTQVNGTFPAGLGEPINAIVLGTSDPRFWSTSKIMAACAITSCTSSPPSVSEPTCNKSNLFSLPLNLPAPTSLDPLHSLANALGNIRGVTRKPTSGMAADIRTRLP
ncbi:hypothetical protein BC826DRAFT_284798 [Russula brevipes]|nr:hypothetical protein BC826DRAFT_284798 [Russula brevipes]